MPPHLASVTFASLKYPASAVACCGVLPVSTFTCSSIGASCFLSLASCVTSAADHLRVAVHRRLRVISLHKLLRRAVLHDSRIRVGKVSLCLRLRLRLLRVRRLRRPPAELPPPLRFLLLAFLQPRRHAHLLLFRSFSRLALQRRLGFANLRQPRFPPRQLRWQLVPASPFPVFPVFLRVHPRRLLQQRLHLRC